MGTQVRLNKYSSVCLGRHQQQELGEDAGNISSGSQALVQACDSQRCRGYCSQHAVLGDSVARRVLLEVDEPAEVL
jgi:hypothetical protein